MSAVRTAAKFGAAAIALAVGVKLAVMDVTPYVKTGPKVPVAAGEVFDKVAPAKKIIIPAAIEPRIAKAATSYARYADLFGYMADGQPASGLAALQSAVSDLKKNRLFKPDVLDAALLRLERAARDIQTSSARTLSQYNTVDLVASMKDGGKAHAFYLAIQNLSYALHSGGQVQTPDLARARAAFFKYSKDKAPVLANLEKVVSMTFMHYNFTRGNLQYSQSDYDANVKEFEPPLASIFKAPLPVPVIKLDKEIKAPALVTVSEFATQEANALSRLMQDDTFIKALKTFRSEAGIATQTEELAALETALKAYKAAPKDGALFRKAAIEARSAMIFATSHPKYDAYSKAPRGAALKKFETTLEAYFKVEPPLRTRCGQGVRAFGCG